MKKISEWWASYRSKVVLKPQELERLLDKREAEVRQTVARNSGALAESGSMPFDDPYSLANAFETRNIPARFCSLAESLGVTAGDESAIEHFVDLVWRSKEERSTSNMREAKNWLAQSRYSDVPIQRLMTETTRLLAQDFSFYWKDKSPFFGGGVKQIRRFVVGKGVTTKVRIEEVDQVWQDFLEYNRWNRRQKDMFVYGMICGELSVVIRKKVLVGGDKWKVSVIPYFEQDFEDALLIEEGDREKVIAVGMRTSVNTGADEIQYFQAADTFDESLGLITDSGGNQIELKTDGYAINMQFYGNVDEVRGRPTFYSVLKWVKVWDDFALNRARLADFRSRILMKKKTAKGGSQLQGGSIQQIPAGGVILNETPDVTYEFMSPNIDSQGVQEDAKWFMYMVCAGLEAPPHVVFQNSENANYASIKESDTPFTQVILDWQDCWEDFLIEVFNLMKKIWVKDGVLLGSYTVEKSQPDGSMQTEVMQTLDLELECTFPEIVKQNVDAKSKETDTLMTKGVLSKETASTRHGLDFEMEQQRIEQESVKDKGKQQADWQQFGIIPPDLAAVVPPPPAETPAGVPPVPAKVLPVPA